MDIFALKALTSGGSSGGGTEERVLLFDGETTEKITFPVGTIMPGQYKYLLVKCTYYTGMFGMPGHFILPLSPNEYGYLYANIGYYSSSSYPTYLDGWIGQDGSGYIQGWIKGNSSQHPPIYKIWGVK